jgi:GT2 family glycosyltransferase
MMGHVERIGDPTLESVALFDRSVSSVEEDSAASSPRDVDIEVLAEAVDDFVARPVETRDEEPPRSLKVGGDDPPAPAVEAQVGGQRVLRGSIDKVTRTHIKGWVWDPKAPEKRVQLELMEGETRLATAVARIDRPDLVPAGIGDGRYAFSIDLKPGLLSDEQHILQLRCADTGAGVPGSPIVLDSSPDVRKPAFRWHLDQITDQVVSGWIVPREGPLRHCVVALKEGDTVLVRAVASQFRADLLSAGIGDGCHAFRLPMPHTLLDGHEHRLEIIEEGTGFALTEEPVQWRSMAGTAGAALTGIGGQMRDTSADGLEPTVILSQFPGCIDFYGYCSAAGGWLFSGWVPRPPRIDQSEPVEIVARYEQSHIGERATVAFYQRDDLDYKSIGVTAFLPSSSRVVGSLQNVTFSLDGVKYQAVSSHSTVRVLDQELVDRVRVNLVNRTFANRNRDYLLSIISRRGFTGQDTLSSLGEPVLMEIDEAFSCPPNGVLLKGWQLSVPGTIRSIRVRSGHRSGEMVLSHSIRIARPDVIAAVGKQIGLTDTHCGFIAYVPSAISHSDVTYIEVELENGEVGFKNLKISKGSGLDAIRGILEGIDVRYGEINSAFDKVLGPAISAINSARLQEPSGPRQIEFGRSPESPRCTLIIPLFGRLDFVEYQMALFSQTDDMLRTEIIYVLDDPTKRRELEVLAQSVFERFQIPFRLLLLPTNLGFGPASNVGLRSARGQFICFLNSDIFPITQGWIERLVERLERNQDIGVIGAQLLFEDGSIQHEGCFYRNLLEFGNWTFVEHQNKGLRPVGTRGLRHCDMITGACMVMERSLAVEFGGFDEAFIVGDFEDSDLCLRVRDRGLCCAVDHDVQLYHLERKSQAAPGQSWRMNLTLYNAWVHQRRWFGTAIAARETQTDSI